MATRRIRLVVTGDLEKKALALSLQHTFPNEDFEGNSVQWLASRMVHGATSHRLDPQDEPSRPMRELAKAAVAEALEGAGAAPADLVLVVDDLEVMNVDQPHVVCDHFRRAMLDELETRDNSLLAGEQADMRARVRQVCSFHLLSPMVEAYFFGETQALVRAGCAPTVRPVLRSTDCEDFWCSDQDFLPECARSNAEKASMPNGTSWREERHAKHYLEHLRSLEQDHPSPYEETTHGAAALHSLDWRTIPKQNTHCPLVAALFADISDFLGTLSPLDRVEPSPYTYSGPPPLHNTRVLRNL